MLSLMSSHTHTHTHTHTPSYSSRYQIIKHWTPRAKWKTDMHDARSDMNHLMVKNHLEKPPLRHSQFSFYIVWDLSWLSFHTCNYGIFISWCRRPAFIRAVGFTHGDNAAMVNIHWPLDDVDHINVGPNPTQQYHPEYYRHQGLRPRWAVFVMCVFHDCWKQLGPALEDTSQDRATPFYKDVLHEFSLLSTYVVGI